MALVAAVDREREAFADLLAAAEQSEWELHCLLGSQLPANRLDDGTRALLGDALLELRDAIAKARGF